MALVANGATLHFDGYEYGVVNNQGDVIPCETFEQMHAIYAHVGQEMRFRAVYRTDWWDATE